MKDYIKLIIYILIFIVLIVISVKSYQHLTQEYSLQEELQNQAQEETEIQKASDFTVMNMNEEAVKLSDYVGKQIVVSFWATWCGPCKMELPAFDELYKQYNEKVEFMMVNLTDGYQETVEGVKTFISENGYEFPVFFDTEQSALEVYNLYSIPRTIFVDKDGNLVNSHTGAMSESTLKQYIEILIGE